MCNFLEVKALISHSINPKRDVTLGYTQLEENELTEAAQRVADRLHALGDLWSARRQSNVAALRASKLN